MRTVLAFYAPHRDLPERPLQASGGGINPKVLVAIWLLVLLFTTGSTLVAFALRPYGYG